MDRRRALATFAVSLSAPISLRESNPVFEGTSARRVGTEKSKALNTDRRVRRKLRIRSPSAAVIAPVYRYHGAPRNRRGRRALLRDRRSAV